MFKQGDVGSSAVGEPFAEEAKYFVEVRLLQREVKIVLESVSNQNFIGSVIHPVSVLFSPFLLWLVILNVCIQSIRINFRWHYSIFRSPENFR